MICQNIALVNHVVSHISFQITVKDYSASIYGSQVDEIEV